MKKYIIIEKLGLSPYKATWEYQQKIHNKLNSLKKDNVNGCLDLLGHLIFCEHPHVYTLGKHGNQNNLLLDKVKLSAEDIEFFNVDRGGDITYHGPGQIVGYPIFDLYRMKLGVKDYIHKMEQAIIDMLKEYNIIATLLDGATGVWLDIDIPDKIRKICAIGVRVSCGITMHGFALNVNTNLDYFNYINPCGFTDKKVTSMQVELGKEISMEEVKNKLQNHFIKQFGINGK